MLKLKIFEHDFKESFIRSSGPGGQNINKVSTCVVLRHIPTGIQVKCQAQRTQKANRFKARCLIVDKIERIKKDEAKKARYVIEKNKRMSRKKPSALKEKILEQKHIRSDKKSSRKKVDLNKLYQY